MATIDFEQISKDSLALAKKEVGTAWTRLKPFAEHEFRQFAENAVFLAKLKVTGTIDDEELRARLQIQRLALTNVLLAIKGIGLVTAQNVVNGILTILSTSINKAISVVLPI